VESDWLAVDVLVLALLLVLELLLELELTLSVAGAAGIVAGRVGTRST
jgi:preprotein translocase subunit SecD